MKRFLTFMMALALVLCAACGKQTETPITPNQPPVQEQPAPETPEVPASPEQPPVQEQPAPETPEAPVTPETPQISETPETPELPVVVEPEGFVSVTKLPKGIPGVEQVLQFIPLQGGASVLLAKGGDKGWIVTYDYMVAEVLDQMEVAVGDQAQMALMDAGTLYYYDGQKEWEILIGGRMGLSSREYDINRRLMMGDKQISGGNGSILVDGVAVLEAQPGKDSYMLVGILGDHRLLYNAYSADNLYGTYGIYDHATGEKKLLTTLGQYMVGAWGDTLLIARKYAGGLYELGKFDLTDYSFTALNIGHEKIDQRVEHIWCSNDGTQMLVTWEDDAGLHVQIFDLESQEERYAWTAPAGEGWNFQIADGSNLAVWQGSPEDLTLWNVNY